MPQIATIATYNYQFHGGPHGYQNSRAILRLQDATNKSVAYVHFVPTGDPIPADTNNPPWIRMYMPESAIPAVIDMLRNEGPVNVYYALNNGFLYTGEEPIGESE